MVKPYITILLATLLFSNSFAQSFVDMTDEIGGLPIAPSRFYGGGISFYDVNEDGLDDLTIPVKNDTLKLWLSNGTGFDIVPLFYVSGEMKMPLWGDYDNDGDNDLYAPVYLGQSRLFRNEGDLNFTDVTATSGLNVINNWKCFGANWLDYNNDGWLDLFQTVYSENLEPPRNFLMQGSESGVFSDISIPTGVRIGSAWSLSACVVDFDDDGDQDIHVANDKPTFDAFLINQGPWFENMAESMGFNVNCNSMSSSVSDYDHDGEYDIFVSNTINLPNLIYKKNETQRYDPWVYPEVDLNRLSWGGLWIDENNDSWDELHISHEPFAGDQQAFFYNISGDLQRGNFTQDGETFYTYGMAKGDFNGDGFYDMANAPYDFLPYKLYLNQGGENNFVRVRLEGTNSNRSGIGVSLKYWLNGEEVIRYSRSGDAYMTQDSQWLILGLGNADSIDSLSVSWLGGNTETYYNIQANQHLVIREGNPLELIVLADDFPNEDGVIQICNTDSTILMSSNNLPVLWSNGQISASIVVNSSGIFSYSFVDPLNEIHYSNQVEVEVIQDVVSSIEKNNPSCWYSTDGSIEVNIPSSWNVSWNNELFPDSLSILNLGSGNFNLQFINDLNCYFDTSITLVSPDSLMWNMNILSPTCHGLDNGSIEITDIVGGTGIIHFWIDSIPASQNLFEDLIEGTYTVVARDENDCISQSEVEIIAPDPLTVEVEVEEEEGQVEIEVSGGVAPYLLDLNDSLYTFWSELDYENQWNNWFVSDANGCAVADSFFIAPQVVIQTIESPSTPDQLIIRNDGMVSFNASATQLLFIHDLSGRLIYSATLKPGITILPRFHSGLYLATWRDAQAKRTKKFVIE